ncbi:hypothetical protein [Bradyrhizobium sp.]|uniref:hypothetical protein n=1 Tax=Bradyrhizobium sp. TaxID=376 RepID=UPI00403790C0
MDTPAKHTPSHGNPVGDLLRAWRARRAMSQADLAFEAGISIEHLSFVGTVLTLGTPQDITLQELRVELFMPADAATEETLGRLGR